MQFKTLGQTDFENIVEAFNDAFADYEIQLQRTKEELLQKIRVEDIDLSLSAGAFDGDTLVGFIFFGIDDHVNGIKTAWDGGTGVIPAYRGHKLTQRMFEFIQPALKQAGVKKILLEVLENNTGAYKIYESLGFRETRKLNAYKGILNGLSSVKYNVEILHPFDIDVLLNFGDFQPPWQQMNKRVNNWGDVISSIGIKHNNDIVAYARYNTTTKRVLQFAVSGKYRRKGMATALFHHIAGDNSTPVTVINVDNGSSETNAFLKTIGLNYFISQYEMEMIL